jgi:Ca-activated chloride channel homolog
MPLAWEPWAWRPYPVQDLWGRTVYQNAQIPIDEETLKKIAFKTDGKYFRATDMDSLSDVYKEINALEKTVVQISGFQEYKELFPWFLLFALLLLGIEIGLSNTRLRRLP